MDNAWKTEEWRVVRDSDSPLGAVAKEIGVQWTINHFKGPGSLRSPADSGRCPFRLELQEKDNKSCVTINRTGWNWHCYKGLPMVMFDVKIYLLNTLYENLDSLQGQCCQLPFRGGFTIYSNILWSSKLDMVSHDNKLLVAMKITAHYNNKTANIVSQPSISNKSSICADFGKLRNDRKFCDFTISVRGTNFNAHKNILTTRSPVFSSMLEHEMNEANLNRVEIEDIEPEVFKEFLDFIYSGDADIKSYAVQLLAAAEKYDVQDLKSCCEDQLIMDMSQENCFETLHLADIYSAGNLKKRALSFIAANKCSVNEDSLDEIQNLSLAKELIEALLNRRK